MTTGNEHRVAASQAAQTIFDLAVEECRGLRDERHFWLSLVKLVREHAPLSPAPAGRAAEPLAMTDRQVTNFGRQVMGFGKHRGKPIDEVPLAYLDFLLKPTEFQRDVKRYLANDTIARQLEVELANRPNRQY